MELFSGKELAFTTTKLASTSPSLIPITILPWAAAFSVSRSFSRLIN
jgi:hypothetical protein